MSNPDIFNKPYWTYTIKDKEAEEKFALIVQQTRT